MVAGKGMVGEREHDPDTSWKVTVLGSAAVNLTLPKTQTESTGPRKGKQVLQKMRRPDSEMQAATTHHATAASIFLNLG